jgi:hypothetical protein
MSNIIMPKEVFDEMVDYIKSRCNGSSWWNDSWAYSLISKVKHQIPEERVEAVLPELRHCSHCGALLDYDSHCTSLPRQPVAEQRISEDLRRADEQGEDVLA